MGPTAKERVAGLIKPLPADLPQPLGRPVSLHSSKKDLSILLRSSRVAIPSLYERARRRVNETLVANRDSNRAMGLLAQPENVSCLAVGFDGVPARPN